MAENKKYVTHCKICDRQLKDSQNSLSIHISGIHKEVTKEEYYLKYIGTKTTCKNCGKETDFIGIQNGYKDFCCRSCSTKVSQWNGERGEKRKEKLSIRMVGNKFSVGRPKGSKNVNDYPMTEYVNKKIEILNEERRLNDWWLGRKHTLKTRNKMSDSWCKKTDKDFVEIFKKRSRTLSSEEDKKYIEKIEKSMHKTTKKLNVLFGIDYE